MHIDIKVAGAGSRSTHSIPNIIKIEAIRVNEFHDESKRIHLNLCFANASFNLIFLSDSQSNHIHMIKKTEGNVCILIA